LIFLLYLCDGDPGTNVVLLKEKYRYWIFIHSG
jgi:hypothetical protein